MALSKESKMAWIAFAFCIAWVISIATGYILNMHMSGTVLAERALNLVGKTKAEVQDQIGKPFATYSKADFEANERPLYREHKDRMPDIEYDEIHRYSQGALILYIYFEDDRVVNFYTHGT